MAKLGPVVRDCYAYYHFKPPTVDYNPESQALGWWYVGIGENDLYPFIARHEAAHGIALLYTGEPHGHYFSVFARILVKLHARALDLPEEKVANSARHAGISLAKSESCDPLEPDRAAELQELRMKVRGLELQLDACQQRCEDLVCRAVPAVPWPKDKKPKQGE